ncbi:MAG: hypothetical protein AAF195_02135 [Pseudomonadota bacterium]
MATTSTAKEIEHEYWNLLFKTDLKSRYHTERSAFILLAERLFLIVSAVIAILLFLEKTPVNLAIIIFIINLIIVIFLPAKKAGIHQRISNDYLDLLSEIENNNAINSNIRNRYNNLRKGEPEFYRALEAKCYNDVSSEKGCSYFIPVNKIHYLFKNITKFQSLPMKAKPTAKS